MAKNYQAVIGELKQKIRAARQQAALAVNAQLRAIYWEIGHIILEQQRVEGWGAKIIDRLAVDLKLEFAYMRGFSTRNIKYMRAFVEAYAHFTIVQPSLAQIPWAHHLILLSKIKVCESERGLTTNQRLFFPDPPFLGEEGSGKGLCRNAFFPKDVIGCFAMESSIGSVTIVKGFLFF